MITLGPFIIRSTHPDTPDGKFLHTGCSMEIFCDGILFQLPIYKDVAHMDGAYACFSDFYFPEPENGWPVDFTFRGWIHDKPTQYGRFIAVSPLLVEIFNQLQPAMAMEVFLRDFRAKIPVFCNNKTIWQELQPGEVNLTDNLSQLGFVVSSVNCYGVALNVDIAWAFPDDISGWKNITAGYIEFRPRCGKLNDGKWIGQRWQECIESHYFKRFAAVAPAKPIECLRGHEDIENLLKHFEWTKTTLHTEAELRQMRIAAVGDAPELWSKPKQLAEYLKSRELYSTQTGVSQIVKFLPGLLKQAGAEERSGEG
jgi:hypothetical protein